MLLIYEKLKSSNSCTQKIWHFFYLIEINMILVITRVIRDNFQLISRTMRQKFKKISTGKVRCYTCRFFYIFRKDGNFFRLNDFSKKLTKISLFTWTEGIMVSVVQPKMQIQSFQMLYFIIGNISNNSEVTLNIGGQ